MQLFKRVRILVCGLLAAMAAMASMHSQNPPGPAVDRVGFPRGYATTMGVLYVYDRPDNITKRVGLAAGSFWYRPFASRIGLVWASFKEAQVSITRIDP